MCIYLKQKLWTAFTKFKEYKGYFANNRDPDVRILLWVRMAG